MSSVPTTKFLVLLLKLRRAKVLDPSSAPSPSPSPPLHPPLPRPSLQLPSSCQNVAAAHPSSPYSRCYYRLPSRLLSPLEPLLPTGGGNTPAATGGGVTAVQTRGREETGEKVGRIIVAEVRREDKERRKIGKKKGTYVFPHLSQQQSDGCGV